MNELTGLVEREHGRRVLGPRLAQWPMGDPDVVAGVDNHADDVAHESPSRKMPAG